MISVDQYGYNVTGATYSLLWQPASVAAEKDAETMMMLKSAYACAYARRLAADMTRFKNTVRLLVLLRYLTQSLSHSGKQCAMQ